MPKIEDGTGSRFEAQVDSENRLSVFAVAEPLDRHINEESAKVWSIPFEDLNPAGADDYVVYIKNTGTKNLLIADIRISADTAGTQVEVQAVSGTAVGGSTITPVSKTVGSSVTPTATIESGTDITGLTEDGILYFIQCAVVDTEYHLRTSSHIIIPNAKAIALLVKIGSANITGIITLIEAE